MLTFLHFYVKVPLQIATECLEFLRKDVSACQHWSLPTLEYAIQPVKAALEQAMTIKVDT